MEHSIFDQLEEAGHSWGICTAATPSLEERILPRLRAEKGDNFFDLDAFFEAARTGSLPAFSWVTSAEEHNEHPPKSVQAGQLYVSGVVEAVMSSPDWPRTALFLTYDEHGGFYDHVAPPAACSPADTAPQLGPKDVAGAFDRLGPRVPFVLGSPYARRHHVSHVVHDHRSILRFVQASFDLPALSARDANAQPPFELFDFESAPDLTIPALPEAVIDPAPIGHCEDTRSTNFDDEPPDTDR